MSAAVLFAFASLFTAQQLDGVAGGRFETSAGQVPNPGSTVTGTAAVRSTLAMEASPTVSAVLTLHAARGIVSYSPRIYYRVPLAEGEGGNKPLVLHRLTLSYAHSIARDLGLNISLSGSEGDLDYVRATTGGVTDPLADPIADPLAEPIDPGLGALPANSVISITSVTGAASLTKTFGSNESLDFELRPSYTKPRTGEADAATAQIRLGGDTTYERSFTSRDTLELVLGGDVIDFVAPSMPTSTTAVTPEPLYLARASARFERVFNRHFTGHVLGGVSTSLEDFQVLPVGELGINWDIHRRGNLHLVAALTVGVDAFASPLLATIDTRFVSTFSFLAEIGSRIDIQLTASIVSTLSESEPIDPDMPIGGGAITETVVQARLPFIYRLGDDASFEVGIRTSARGSRFQDPEFELGQVELVGYASINATIDTRVPEFVR